MADGDMDPDLAALLRQLNEPPPPPAPPGAKKVAPAVPKTASNLPPPISGGYGAPVPPPPAGPPKGGSYTAAKKMAAPTPPPPPPAPGVAKTTSAATSTAKANPVAALFAGRSAAAASGTPPPAPPVSSFPSAPRKSFTVFFDGAPSDSGGYGQGYRVQLGIDRSTTYEEVCQQLFNNLPWHTGAGQQYYGEIPPRPKSPSQIFLKFSDWNCNRGAKLGDIGLQTDDSLHVLVAFELT
eukprot:TRINITY_DN4922_c0_g1_i2.p1 TRINITY_DN4922_c0_g1~~TRINITY_DN4922_c0_g1_i2.p1  ORF type:complete len:247 (-),score=37.02 TRINITY_DN4922_c0_g1_i2:206-919(-)